MTPEEWSELIRRYRMVPKGFEVIGDPSVSPLSYGERPAIALAFSEDSRRIAVSGGGNLPGPVSVQVFDVESGERIACCRFHRMGVHDIAFSPTGLLASASHDYSVVLWNLEQKDAVFVIGGEHAGISRSRVACHGNHLFVGDGMTWRDARAALHRFDLGSGEHRQLLELPEGAGIAELHLNPSGDGLHAVIFEDMRMPLPPYEIRELDPEGAERGSWRFDHELYDLVPTTDGRFAVTGNHVELDDTRLWILGPEGPAEERSLGSEIGAPLARSPDGQQVAIGYATEVLVCSGSDGAIDFQVPLGPERITEVAWSPDGRWIAAGTLDGSVRIIDVDARREHDLEG